MFMALTLIKKKIKSLQDRKSYIERINNFDIKILSKKSEVSDSFENISKCDVILICVPTPLKNNNQPDLSYIKKTFSLIKNYLCENQIFIENLIQGKEIMIKGSPSQRLDFTYIDDFVHGIKRIIQSKNSINQVFNITFGSSESINNMIKILKKNFSNVEINYKKQDKLVPKRGTLSTKKAEKLIGYKPKYNLFKGYGRYVSWYKKQKFF